MYHFIQTKSVGNETTAWEAAAEEREPGDVGRARAAVAWVVAAVEVVEGGRRSPAFETEQTSDLGIGVVAAHIGVEVDTAEVVGDTGLDIEAEAEEGVGIVGTGPEAEVATELEPEAAAATGEDPYYSRKAVGLQIVGGRHAQLRQREL
jgi:hypothetical protein